MEQRRPARSYSPRRPAGSTSPRRPAGSTSPRRPAGSSNSSRARRSSNPRRAEHSCFRKRSARRNCTTTSRIRSCTTTTGIGLKARSGVEAAEKSKRSDVKIGQEGEVYMEGNVVDMRVNWWIRKNNARDLFEKMPVFIDEPWESHRDMWFVYPGKGYVKRMNGHILAFYTFCSISAASEQVYIDYSYITSTSGDYEVTPRMDYCIGMVGFLGRLGELTDAEEPLIKEKPFYPDMDISLALLGVLTNTELGALLEEHIFDLDQQGDISGGKLYGNYVRGGILDETAEVRQGTALDQSE